VQAYKPVAVGTYQLIFSKSHQLFVSIESS